MQYIVVKFNKIIFKSLIINGNIFKIIFKKMFFKKKKRFFDVFLRDETVLFKIHTAFLLAF